MSKLTQDRKRRQQRLLEDSKNSLGAKLFAGFSVLWACLIAGFPLLEHTMSIELSWKGAAALQFALGIAIGGWAVRYYTTELRRQVEDARDELADHAEDQRRDKEERAQRCPESLFALYIALRHADAFVHGASHIASMITAVSENPTRKDIFRINNAIRDLPVIFQERHHSLLNAIIPILQSQGNMGDLNGITDNLHHP